jgi:hypothetical protein
MSPELSEVVELVKASRGCPKEAGRRVLAYLNEHPEVMEEVNEAILHYGVMRSVYVARQHSNSAIKRAVANPCPRGLEVIAATSAAVAATILDLQMPDERTLGDWTGTELLAQVKREENTAAGYLRRARLFGELARIAGKHPVRKKVSVEQADQIWRRVSGGAKGAKDAA